MKKYHFFIRKFSFFGCKIFNIFEWACFRNNKNGRTMILGRAICAFLVGAAVRRSILLCMCKLLSLFCLLIKAPLI